MAQRTHAHELTRAQKVVTMTGVLLALLLAALDQTIVATAGPAMQVDLRIDAAHYPWLTTAYLVASTVMLPIYGKLSDIFGRKPILVVGIVLFVTGSVLCGLSRTSLHVILARVVQGLGSASLFTSAFTVVADLFPPAVRGKYQGLTGAVFALSSVVGPLLGGFLTDAFSWHWVFFINLPVGVVALGFILLKMPALHPTVGETRPRLDLAGALALMLAVVPLLLALSLGRGGSAGGTGGYPWGSGRILGLFALSAVGFGLFVLAERRAADPLIDLDLFRNRIFAVGNATVFILGAGFLSAVVFLPLFMVNVVGLSATRSGLTLTPLTLGVVAGNVLAGQLVSRIGRYRVLMLVSLVVLTVGYALMGFTLTPGSTQAEVTAKMVLVGVGMGPSLPLYTLAIQNAVPPGQVGVATSAVTFFRQIGSTIGVALLGTVFAATLASSLSEGTTKAMAHLPPEVREQFQASGTGGSGGEGLESGQGFSAKQMEAELREGFAARELELETKLTGPAKAEAMSRLRAEEARTLAAVDEMGQALKDGFTEAISAIYRIAIFISVLGFLLTLFLPERPLRRTNAPLPPE